MNEAHIPTNTHRVDQPRVDQRPDVAGTIAISVTAMSGSD
jgi:hypothetical protein